MAYVYRMKQGPAPGVDYKTTYERVDLDEVRTLALGELDRKLVLDPKVRHIADRTIDTVFRILEQR